MKLHHKKTELTTSCGKPIGMFHHVADDINKITCLTCMRFVDRVNGKVFDWREKREIAKKKRIIKNTIALEKKRDIVIEKRERREKIQKFLKTKMY